MLQYQAFVNEWRSDIDVERCNWALQVLELSTIPTLLVEIKQLLDILPKTQQGGLTLFKLHVNKLDAKTKTFENTKLFRITLQDFVLTVFLVKMCPLVLPASRLLPNALPTRPANQSPSALSLWDVSLWE